jgi:hypothetical protein
MPTKPREYVCVLPDAPEWAAGHKKPYIIHSALRVFEAAMVYADRHPNVAFLGDLDISDPNDVAILEEWIGKPSRPRTRLLGDVGKQPNETDEERALRVSWEIARELSEAITTGAIKPVRVERDGQGRIIPLACTIKLKTLLKIARRRGDAGRIVSSLAGVAKRTGEKLERKRPALERAQRFICEHYPNGTRKASAAASWRGKAGAA